MKTASLVIGWTFAVLAGCAAPATSGLVLASRCPVSDITTARAIAMAVISQNANADHINQTGYQLDVSDEGQFWLAQDGPNLTGQGEAIVMQAGGSSIQFRIAKCSGAVSDFGRRVWR